MDLPPLEAIRAELARRSLAHFVRQAWPIIEPSTPLVWNWHLDAICDHLQALVEGRLVRDGRRLQNLIINVPPGSMKSTIVSVCLTAWAWIQRSGLGHLGPGFRGLFASGNEGVAIRDSLKCRDILDSDWYRDSFGPGWAFTKDQNAKGHYKNTATGFRRATSAGARITGDRAHLIAVDDPNDAAEAYSKAAREQIITWWDQAAANRLADMNTGCRVIIQQRLHEEDLTGHVLTVEPEAWEVLVIRQEWEVPKPEDPDFKPTTLGWVDPRAGGPPGALMFPARFPAAVVEGERRRLGGSGFAGQHQQRPAPAEGAIFRHGFIGEFSLEHPPHYQRVIISLDTAFKEKEENDYSVATVWGEWESGFDIIHRWKDRASYPTLKSEVKRLADAWRSRGLTALLIEDKASGQSLIQDLRKETSLPVVPIKVDTDKVSRAHAVVPLWEAGKIRAPEGAEWVRDWLDQLYGFPKLAHDDDVDSTTQALNYLNLGGGSTGILEWMRREAIDIKVRKAMDDALEQIHGFNGGMTVAQLIEAHGEIGHELWKAIQEAGHAAEGANGRLALTAAGIRRLVNG